MMIPDKRLQKLEAEYVAEAQKMYEVLKQKNQKTRAELRQLANAMSQK